MSVKERGKNLETKVVRGAKTVGRDVKKGLGRAGRKLNSGAHTLGRDARRTGKATGAATKRGWADARRHLKRKSAA
jgi:hypothetical protein